jgi:outer membrane protein assembly factor BamB
MPICSKCRCGFDSDTGHCPYCGTYIPQSSRHYSGNDRSSYRQVRSPFYRPLPLGFWKVLLVTAALLGIARFGLNFVLEYWNQPQKSLLAIDAKTGKIAWSVPLDDEASESQFANWSQFTIARGDRVFVSKVIESKIESKVKERYYIQTFSASTGQKLWSFSPSVSASERIYGYELETQPQLFPGNTLLLHLPLEEMPITPTIDPRLVPPNSKPPVARNERLRKGKIIAIDPSTGKQRWTIDRNWNISISPGKGIASSGESSAILRIMPNQKVWIETYRTATGKKLWQTQLTGSPRWEKDPGNLYRGIELVANQDAIAIYNVFTRTIEGYDWMSGKLKFALKVGDLRDVFGYYPYRSQIAVSNSTLYYVTSAGRLEAIDPSNGTKLWSSDLSGDSDRNGCSIRHVGIVAEDIHLVCHDFTTISSGDRLLFIDSKAGRIKSTVNISKFAKTGELESYYNSGISINSKYFVAYISYRYGGLLAGFTRDDEQAIWIRGLRDDDIEINQYGFSTAVDRIFMKGSVPRRKSWQSSFDNR